MWKKVIPVAAVLILAWIGLNLMTAKDAEESVAHAPDAATSDVTEPAEADAEALHLAENAAADTTPETAPTDEETADTSADTAPTDEETADTSPDTAPTDEETADTSPDTAPTDEETADVAEEISPADAEPEVDTTNSDDATDAAPTVEEAEVTEATESINAEALTDEKSTETSEIAAVAADASGSTVAMRYPSDPATGATIYDQGMVEVIIEPTVEPVETEPEQGTDTTESVAEELAVTEQVEIVEPVMVNKVAMRYPTDPVTGATIFDQGMVEVEFESVVEPNEEIAETAPDPAAEVLEIVEGKGNTQMRYPTDPVTGATLYDQGMVEVAIESDTKIEEVAESAADQSAVTDESAEGDNNVQMRYPTDPVTGATLYDQGMVEVALESDAEVEDDTESAADQVAENAEDKSEVQMRYPTDPVTGATLYDQGMVEVAIESTEDEDTSNDTESSSEDVTETVASEATTEPTPVTAATENTAAEEIVTEVADTDSDTETTTREVAAIAERGTFSLGAISRTLGGVFGSTTTVLSTARDEASAQAVLPRLQAASSSLNAVADQYATLPEYAKGPLGKVIKRGMASLKPLADTALTREGVGPVLMPVMGPMLDSLQAMLR